MKQPAANKIIDRGFKKLQGYAQVMFRGFEEVAIHEFRTGIKRSRAVLRLLNVSLKKKDRLQLSKKLRVFYWYAGSVRNLQLHLHTLDKEDEKPVAYMRICKKQIESLEGAMRSFASPGLFRKKKNCIRGLPFRGKVNPKEFLQQKIGEFNSLLSNMDKDEALHAIRKALKDILYNWKYIRHLEKLMPLPLRNKKDIEELTHVLGDFCDRTVGINMVEQYRLSHPGNTEGPALEKIINNWRKEKEELRMLYLSRAGQSPA